MPRPRKRPQSAPAKAPPLTHTKPQANVALPGAGQPAEPAHPRDADTQTRELTPVGSPTSAAALAPLVAVGVGLDTSRYGHHASFLASDLEDADADLDFVESGAGYQQFRARLDALAAKLGSVHFHFRVDVAGRYADNLLAFLHRLPFAKTISCGDPERNQKYKVAIYGHKKSDAAESHACARFALTEKPQAVPVASADIHLLAAIASRLEAQTRQGTRYVNQLHNLLASTFPELGLLVNDLSTGWVLKLLERYPTAAKLAKAQPAALKKIPYLQEKHIPALLENARTSVASVTGPVAEQLVKDHVQQVKDAHARQKSLEKMLVDAYRRLPFQNHLDSIIGFGEVTAAVLTAKIVAPDRFVLPKNVVGHFGVYPVEASSGLDRHGQPREPKRMVMCPRGNDLVRRFLYMASLSAIQHNPAVQPLYLRVLAKHNGQAGIALGHVMAKLLRIALAVWKSGKPFDPHHYDWQNAAHLPGSTKRGEDRGASGAEQGPKPQAESAPAAGHTNPALPERKVVTAAQRITTLPAASAQSDIHMSPTHAAPTSASDIPMSQPNSRMPAGTRRVGIDFAHLKSQLSIERVLDHLGLSANLKGRGRQRRGPCPVHDKDGKTKGRTFAVQLDQNAFYCFYPPCGIKGDVIDLWARLKGLKVRDAALDLVHVFNLEPAPRTEKRNG
jgi:transposase